MKNNKTLQLQATIDLAIKAATAQEDGNTILAQEYMREIRLIESNNIASIDARVNALDIAENLNATIIN